MPSANKTPNYDLNQWQGNEYPKRQDFVDDNSAVDAALKENADGITAHKADKNNPHGVTAAQAGAVPTSRKVNGHALSNDVTVTKSDVGLENADNTADEDKPVSTAVQTALNGKVPTTRKVNGHALSADVAVTKSDVGLGNVDNTSDANKPVSTATQAEITNLAGSGRTTETVKANADNISALQSNKADKTEIPAQLPNPQALTISQGYGGTTGTYNGSTAKSISIPHITLHTSAPGTVSDGELWGVY